MATNADGLQRSPPHARTNRESAGERLVSDDPLVNYRSRSPTRGVAPATLYAMRIAVLEAYVATLEARVEQKERQRQHVVDRYEHLLQSARPDEPTAERPTADPVGLLERFQRLF